MAAYLRDHPPARSQFRSPRRATVSGVIAVHTAENAPDYVAFDGGAEAVARFIQGRSEPGSYHDLVDSDSAIHMVDWGDEAYHDGTGTNPHSLSVSIATRADTWPWAPQAWRDGAIDQAARAAARQARWVKATTGISIPPARISAAQARNRVPGFVSHAQLDPTRRTDPGEHFPWSQFLEAFARHVRDDSDSPQEDDMPLTDEDVNRIAASVWNRPVHFRGTEKQPATLVMRDIATHARAGAVSVDIDALAVRVAALVDGDVTVETVAEALRRVFAELGTGG